MLASQVGGPSSILGRSTIQPTEVITMKLEIDRSEGHYLLKQALKLASFWSHNLGYTEIAGKISSMMEDLQDIEKETDRKQGW